MDIGEYGCGRGIMYLVSRRREMTRNLLIHGVYMLRFVRGAVLFVSFFFVVMVTWSAHCTPPPSSCLSAESDKGMTKQGGKERASFRLAERGSLGNAV